jgi:hypothetical protein
MGIKFTAGAAGSYSGSAAVNFETEAVNGSGLGNLGIGSQSVGVNATVDAIAVADLQHTSGYSFSPTGADSAILDFGTITQGSNTVQAAFDMLNNITGQADLLTGLIDDSAFASTPFGLLGSTSFSLGDLGTSVFDVTFNTNSSTGFFTELLVLDVNSYNSTQGAMVLTPYDLTVEGTINAVQTGGGGVPDSGAAWLLLGLGLASLVLVRRWAS